MNYLILLILQSLYFMLPAYFANMAPDIFKKVNLLLFPVDFNKTWKGKPIFGSHKTWGGLLYACLAGILTFLLQRYLFKFDFFNQLSIIDYSSTSLFLGFLLGFGAIFGDLIESFLKRRASIEPGKPWIPFDQLDFVLGALLFSLIATILPWRYYLIILIISPILHVIFDHLGYYLKIRKSKW